jgi:hypothetical protein
MFVLELHNVLFIKRFLFVRFLAWLVEKGHVKLRWAIDFLFAVDDTLDSFEEFLVFVGLG